MRWRDIARSLGIAGVLAGPMLTAPTAEPISPHKTGVQTPGVQHQMAELVPVATFPVEGRPDWVTVTLGAVWVASSNVNHVVRLDPKTNRPGSFWTTRKPSAGTAEGCT